jgi:phenylpyruvate tautomerase PptA (4-oxalocrotonate tautomerase family)
MVTIYFHFLLNAKNGKIRLANEEQNINDNTLCSMQRIKAPSSWRAIVSLILFLLQVDFLLQLQGREGDRVMMHLVMRSGRSNQSKQAFYKKVVENLAANPGIPPENVMITISENHDIDWSFRDGLAQFIVNPH